MIKRAHSSARNNRNIDRCHRCLYEFPQTTLTLGRRVRPTQEGAAVTTSVPTLHDEPVHAAFFQGLRLGNRGCRRQHCNARAKQLSPSARGELEIADLICSYLADGTLDAVSLGRGVAWLDTGTPDSLLEAANYIAAVQHQSSKQIACLEEDSRELLLSYALEVLEGTSFEVAGGLQLEDEMRATIALHVALLGHRLPPSRRPTRLRIILYPDYFSDPDRLSMSVRMGEVGEFGAMALAWRSVLLGGLDPDAVNVVIHELAHVLDGLTGDVDGMPLLSNDEALY